MGKIFKRFEHCSGATCKPMICIPWVSYNEASALNPLARFMVIFELEFVEVKGEVKRFSIDENVCEICWRNEIICDSDNCECLAMDAIISSDDICPRELNALR